MERRRVIAAAPVRSAFDAWNVVKMLLAATLERSPSVPVGSVDKELTPLNGLGPALIAGGHLEPKGLILIDSELHLTIVVLTGDAALEVEENLNPVPGGASATDGRILYVPSVGPLDKAVALAVKSSSHLSVASPPTSSSSKDQQSRQSLVDLNALRKIGGKS